MKLLLDANLSWRLIKKLSEHFSEVHHVDHCGLSAPASDTEIWEWAKKYDATIITNDDDYYHLIIQKGFPPKVVLLRTGNQSTRLVAQTLIDRKSNIEDLYTSSQYGLLEIL